MKYHLLISGTTVEIETGEKTLYELMAASTDGFVFLDEGRKRIPIKLLNEVIIEEIRKPTVLYSIW